MCHRSLIFLLISVSVAAAQNNSYDEVQDSSRHAWPDSLESFASYVYSHVEELAPAGYKAQRDRRAEFYRKGYADILYASLKMDGIEALLAFVRSRLHVEFAMPHKIFVVGDPEWGVALPDDWSFPRDPWARPGAAER